MLTAYSSGFTAVRVDTGATLVTEHQPKRAVKPPSAVYHGAVTPETQQQAGLAPGLSERPAAIQWYQRVAGNRAVSRMVGRASAPRRTVIQRVINGQINVQPVDQLRVAQFPDASVPTYGEDLAKISMLVKQATNFIQAYNANNGAVSQDILLKRILEALAAIEANYLANTLPYLTSLKNQSDADRRTYEVLLLLRDQWTPLMRSVNDEIAGRKNVQRAGAGNRPDVKESVTSTFESGALNLTIAEKQWVQTFLQGQGKTDKTIQEALTAVWAMRQGHFQDLSSGKGNPYKKKGTNKEADVEYQTTDANKPKIWDQKAIVFGKGQTGFEGRLDKTYNKAEDSKGADAPVGLLFDSTFVDERNYEIAWAKINSMLMDGSIPPTAIKEVKAAQPNVFMSNLHVNMAEKVKDDDPDKAEKANVKWAENKKNGQQGNHHTIAKNALPQSNLAQILNGTIHPYSRYSNDRSWLPSGVVYNEYGTGIADSSLNEGKLKYVVSADLQHAYLSVTHYTGYSVTPSGGQPERRNPFFKLV